MSLAKGRWYIVETKTPLLSDTKEDTSKQNVRRVCKKGKHQITPTSRYKSGECKACKDKTASLYLRTANGRKTVARKRYREMRSRLHGKILTKRTLIAQLEKELSDA